MKFLLKIHKPSLKIKSKISSYKAKKINIYSKDIYIFKVNTNKTLLDNILCNEKKIDIEIGIPKYKEEKLNFETNRINVDIKLNEININSFSFNNNISIKDNTKLLKDAYFPVNSLDDIKEYNEEIIKIKKQMIRKKYTSKEYVVLGIYKNIPENIKYKYDSNKNKLFICILDNSLKIQDFAIIKMKNMKIIKHNI